MRNQLSMLSSAPALPAWGGHLRRVGARHVRGRDVRVNTVALICTITAVVMIFLAIAAYISHRRHQRMLRNLRQHHVDHQQTYGAYQDSAMDPIVELMRTRDGF